MMLFFARARTLFSVKVVTSVPKTAMPTAPPIFLIRARIEEATPISSGGTDEAIRLVRWAMPEPMKSAMSDNGQMMSHGPERGSRYERKNRASAPPKVPQNMTERGGNFANRVRPSTMAASGMHKPIGIKSKPDCVAV
jgi:hypothetical protein